MGLPIATLVEYDAPGLTEDEAAAMARRAATLLAGLPGLLTARFWGDFTTGRHCFQLVWRDQAALDAYLASEMMLGVRAMVAGRVVGPPHRRVVRDYTPTEGEA